MFAIPRFAAFACCIVVMAVPGIGLAQTARVSFAIPSGTLGTSQACRPITAYGCTAPASGAQASGAQTGGAQTGEPTAAYLLGRTSGNGETGLAFAYDHAIKTPAGSEAVVFGIGALAGQDRRAGFGSVQSGEGWRVGFSSATLPTNGPGFSGYVTGTTDLLTTFDPGIRNTRRPVIEATFGSLLLTLLSATSVPGPASITLLAPGSCFVFSNRRIKTEAQV